MRLKEVKCHQSTAAVLISTLSRLDANTIRGWDDGCCCCCCCSWHLDAFGQNMVSADCEPSLPEEGAWLVFQRTVVAWLSGLYMSCWPLAECIDLKITFSISSHFEKT